MNADSTDRALTVLLRAWQAGDQASLAKLMRQIVGDLQRMAASRLRGAETPSLASHDLVQEALLKVMQSPPEWQNRAHFFATMSLAMRSVLVDHARARQADKRGGQWQQITYTLSAVGEESIVADLLTLDQLLTQLAALDGRAAEVLQMTYFAGMERAEIATVLGVSVPTVDRELRFARAWLSEQLGRDLQA
ncbi:MAG: sigma-70 family RNA polymerase sigma factor [Burkholderiales bacterium]|nr:sigma-70 family RNA polymerase sigma factor [Burkholderiales bacterium]MCA3227346.1 sigma-70 family RNA polymerase sigma factor [Burkholderiales bacterium]MCE2646477.1 sigma-70 family RNA polymerase sigma factor [Burkholderiaceae bacterium]